MRLKIQVCINNNVLAEGVKAIIDENFPEVVLGDQQAGSKLESPDLLLFTSRCDILDLKDNYPEAKFICFDQGMSDSEIACLLYCHGISGIISSSLDIKKFCKALKSVYQGEIWLEQQHLHFLLEQRLNLPDRQSMRKLSQNDRRIVQMVACGKTNKEIADCLCLSVPTIKAHLSRIFKKLNVSNRSQLAGLVIKDQSMIAE